MLYYTNGPIFIDVYEKKKTSVGKNPMQYQQIVMKKIATYELYWFRIHDSSHYHAVVVKIL